LNNFECFDTTEKLDVPAIHSSLIEYLKRANINDWLNEFLPLKRNYMTSSDRFKFLIGDLQ